MDTLKSISFAEVVKGTYVEIGTEGSEFIQVTDKDTDQIHLVDLLVSGCTRAMTAKTIPTLSDKMF